mgnify:CR=1 FL=1
MNPSFVGSYTENSCAHPSDPANSVPVSPLPFSDEEDHDQTMCGGEHVEQVRITEDLHPRLLKFHPHADAERAANDPCHDSEHQVHDTDVLVVGRIDPAAPSGRMAMCRMCFGRSHFGLPLSDFLSGAACHRAHRQTGSPPHYFAATEISSSLPAAATFFASAIDARSCWLAVSRSSWAAVDQVWN